MNQPGTGPRHLIIATDQEAKYSATLCSHFTLYLARPTLLVHGQLGLATTVSQLTGRAGSQASLLYNATDFMQALAASVSQIFFPTSLSIKKNV